MRLLVGTTKGLFIVSPDSGDVAGPHCDLWPINHAIRDGNAMWAAGGNDWFGAGIWRSGDQGQTWDLTKLSLGQMDAWLSNDPESATNFGIEPCTEAQFDGETVSAIWSLGRVGSWLYAGGKPGFLARSGDNGNSWQGVDGFNNHPSRDSWEGGAAGLIPHTIVSHPTNPAKAWVCVSAAGVFATEDDGATWDRRNRLSNAEACQGHSHPAAPSGGETGHCVHHMMRAPGEGDLLYQQNHHGVWRSSDGGRSWDDVTSGLPSTFGFPLRVHPRDPQTIWTIPLNGDMQGRFPPEASAAVWKSTNGGETWEAKRTGLPRQNCYFTVLRQAMSGDMCDPAGLYFGTNTGSIFASRDEGETWEEIARHLPTVLSVEVA